MAGNNNHQAAAGAGERSVWLFWAVVTSIVSFKCMVKLNNKLVGHKSVTVAAMYSTHVLMNIISLLVFYHLFLLTYITFNPRTKPLKLSPCGRLLVDVGFGLFTFGLAYYKRDHVWFVLLGFSVCLHMIPVLNILGAFCNFTAMDALLAVLIQAAALVSFVDQAHAPTLVGIMSLVLLLFKTYNCKEQPQQYYTKQHGW